MMITDDSFPPSRRTFAFGMASMAALGITGVGFSQEEKKIPDAKALAEAMEVVVRQRFGKILNEDQLKRVLASVLSRRSSGDSLKAHVLENGDDPSVAFRADLP